MVVIFSSTMDLEQPQDSTGGSVDKESAYNAGDMKDKGLIPGLGRSPGEGHGNPLQYPCLENHRGREALWATVLMVSKTQTKLKPLSTLTAHTPGGASGKEYICQFRRPAFNPWVGKIP